ncbi:hypothetical protein PIB30_033605 [Stylosanthes scabra]|uniref:Uncharacterized protein n=1 Tax=Stylosanthes scabra TaxID=79078 RepID=A0ABU6Z9E7_9FABA|nr:hypothetical protein [Stylosanthes scabra]
MLMTFKPLPQFLMGHKPRTGGQMQTGLETNCGGGFRVGHQMGNGVRNGGEDGGESFKREMRDLAELFSKLNKNLTWSCLRSSLGVSERSFWACNGARVKVRKY